jgi:hypothetical protein
VTYATEADWLAAAVTQSGATVTFDTFTPQDSNVSSIGPLSGMNFSAIGNTVLVPNLYGGSPWGTGTFLMTTESGYDLRVDFTTAVTAFATLMMIENGGSGSSMTIKVNGVTVPGPSLSPTGAWPTFAKWTPTFFGIVSTNPVETFNSITFTPTNNLVRLDNVRVGAYNDPTPPPPPPPPPPPVPEPGTGLLALGGIGLIALGCLRKRC